MEEKDVKPTKVAASSMSLRERILNADDSRQEVINLEKYGWGRVLCKNMTGRERARIQKMLKFNVDGTMRNDATNVDTVIAGAYDPDTGKKLFEPTDAAALMEHNTAPLEKIADCINKLSGISRESADEAEKN